MTADNPKRTYFALKGGDSGQVDGYSSLVIGE